MAWGEEARWSARNLMLGKRNRSSIERSALSRGERSLPCRRTRSREWPPRSKKLSCDRERDRCEET